jgi:dienelactone hydrolase
MTKNIKKVFIVSIICGIAILSLSGGLYYYQKDVIVYLYDELIEKGKSFAFTHPSSEIEFVSGGLTLRGSLYLPNGKGPFPGIVLTHGGTKLGRKLPLYRILGHTLAQRGYAVLSFDFRGYGESEDPEKFDTPADLDFVEDVVQAISYLSSVEGVDASKIYLVGHSFGAGVIVPAGVQDKRVKGIVAIAPGRQGYKLFWSKNAPAKHYPRQRLAEDTKIPQLQRVPVGFINPILQYVTIDTILEHSIHPPILLIDGELENPKDLAFLKNLYEEITEPKAYVTIQNADHYFGVKRENEIEFFDIVTYWNDIVEELVGTIDTWIQEIGEKS